MNHTQKHSFLFNVLRIRFVKFWKEKMRNNIE